MLNIALAQINPTVGDFAGNLRLIEAAALRAQAQRADIVVYPELALTGYYPGDLLDSPAFADQVSSATTQLLRFSKEQTPGLALVVGLPLPRGHAPGKRWHNGLLVVRDGKTLVAYAKQLLPTYGVFDERRHFEPGPDVARVARIRGTNVGFLICEDGWNNDGKAYAVNPFDRLRDVMVDLVISINASPASAGKQAQREALLVQACHQNNLPLVYVNQVGGQDSLVYDGASFAATPAEGLVFRAKAFETDLPLIAFQPQTADFRTPGGDPLPPVPAASLPPLEAYRRQIVLGLRDYARRCGFTKAVVGSSGGIDSALTLALATQALGAQNVVALSMPSSISSDDSVVDSLTLARNLGIEHVVVPISAQVQAFQQVNQACLGEPLQGLALENLQARIRGTTLMAYSNTSGHLVLTTGNKSEISVGYCTLYGDTNGGLGLIGDLYKTEVYALARHLNASAGCALIPQPILDKEPSAELAPGQKDSDNLPPYDVLDVMLKWLIEGDALPEGELEATREAFDELTRTQPETIRRVQRLIARSEYKRRQAPPLLRLRARAFGSGRQIPITAVQFED